MRQLVRQSDNGGAALPTYNVGGRSALVVGRQRPEMALELLWVESLLAMTGEDRLDGGVTEPHQADTTSSRFGVRRDFELGASS